MVAVADEVEQLDDPDPVTPDPPSTTSGRWLGRVVLLVAVGVPLGLFVIAALGTVVTFDGAMNLQVAQNLATGDGWIRQYGQPTPFPSEVQTSGAFIVVAAGAIFAFGTTQLGLQAANLLFIALLLVATTHLLRGHRVAQLLVPTLLLVGMPQTSFLSIGGLGEVPVFACVLTTFVLLARVASDEAPRPHVELFLATAFTVTAVTIKTVAVAALPVVVVGLVAAALVNRRVRPVHAVAAVVAGLLPIVVVEGHKLLALGGLGPYQDYWDGLRDDIDYQAGVATGEQLPLAEKVPEHLRILSLNTDQPKWLLVGLFAVPVVLSLVLLVRHRRRLRAVIEDRLRFCAVLLTGYAGLYAVWWFAYTPTEKAWLRRLYPGLLAAQLATMLFLVVAVDVARRRDVLPSRRNLAIAGAGVLGILTVAGPARTAVDEGQRLLDPPVAQLESFEDAAATIADDDEHRYWGEHFASAPAVSLMAETDFGDISVVDMCTIDPERDILVWDYVANGAFGPPEERGTRELTPVQEFPSAATFYAVGPAEGLCPPE